MQLFAWFLGVFTSTALAAAIMCSAANVLSAAERANTMPPFEPAKAGFSVTFNKELAPYTVTAAFAMPGERLSFAATPAGAAGRYRVTLPSGEELSTPTAWKWTAPAAPGLYPIGVADSVSGTTITINVFVMVPASEVDGEVLNGYRIGRYPQIAYKGLDVYLPPRGFVEVTLANRDTPVSPHFTLGQFLCKQEGGWPKYVVLRERLLLKLELLLQMTNDAGHRCDTFAVLSGYRTPYYNRLIGNVKYSRHLWGGAADIFVDSEPVDGVMDDLDGNGTLDVRDAHVLFDIADRMYGKPWYEPFVGGLGAYRTTPNHGPFVHIDARGFRARWGD